MNEKKKRDKGNLQQKGMRIVKMPTNSIPLTK